MLRAIPPSSQFWRIAPQLAGATVVLLLLVAIGTTVLSERAYTSQKVDEVTVSARILAGTVTAALAFDDRNTAAEYVGYLRANPEIVAAAVYDAGGQLFASYARQGQRLPPTP